MKKALQHKIRKETHAKGKQNKHKRGISTPTATGCALRYPFHEAMSCLIPLTPGQRLDDGNALTPGPRIKKVSRNQTMASNPLPFLQTLRGTTTNSTNCIFPYSKRDGVNMKRPDEPSIRPASPSKSQLHRNGNPQSRAKSLENTRNIMAFFHIPGVFWYLGLCIFATMLELKRERQSVDAKHHSSDEYVSAFLKSFLKSFLK